MNENKFQIDKDDDKPKNGINLDYDYNTEYGDGDIPEIDKPKSSNITTATPEEFPKRNKPSTK